MKKIYLMALISVFLGNGVAVATAPLRDGVYLEIPKIGYFENASIEDLYTEAQYKATSFGWNCGEFFPISGYSPLPIPYAWYQKYITQVKLKVTELQDKFVVVAQRNKDSCNYKLIGIFINTQDRIDYDRREKIVISTDASQKHETNLNCNTDANGTTCSYSKWGSYFPLDKNGSLIIKNLIIENQLD